MHFDHATVTETKNPSSITSRVKQNNKFFNALQLEVQTKKRFYGDYKASTL